MRSHRLFRIAKSERLNARLRPMLRCSHRSPARSIRSLIGSAYGLHAVELALGPIPAFAGNRLRTEALRAAGVRIARASLFWGFPHLTGPGDICCRLTIGSHCGFNVGCHFGLDTTIDIGNHVAVGHDVMFLTRTFAAGPADKRAGAEICAPIVVGDGAWLGARCTILPGVTIGAGAVIGASVVVSRDVAPDTLLTGSQTVSLARWRRT